MPRALAFVGSLTQPVPFQPQVSGIGISVFEFEGGTGALSKLSETRGIDNPSFLVLHPRLPVLYATSEVWGWNEGTVAAYRIDAAGGRLIYVNKQPTLGSLPAHASLSADGRFLFVANYRAGEAGDLPGQSLAVFPIRADGGIAPPCASTVHDGSGPVADRQEGPHPHCVLPSPDGRFLLAADLGTDEVVVYRFDAARGVPERVSALAMRPGTGPRHLAWHPNGSVVYVNGELDQTVSALHWRDGTLRCVQTVPTLPVAVAGVNHTADLHVSADGRFAYCSNRGHDSIAVFALSETGELRPLGQTFTGGATPRGFCLDGAGQNLLVANQASDTLTVLRRDPATGGLSAREQPLAVGTPMCVRVWQSPL